VDGTVNYTVGVALQSSGGKTNLALSFPCFAASLYYDPTSSFQERAISDGDLVAISTQADGSLSTGGSSGTTGGSSGSTTTAAKNSADGASGAWRIAMAAAGGALLALLAL
jgi:hypothetical protein